VLLWSPSPYAAALIVTAVGAAAGIVPVAWQKRRLPEGWALFILPLAASRWTFTYGLELGASSLHAKLWMTGLEYIGIVSVPLAWFCFILQYSSHGRWLTPRRLAALAVIPVATVALAWTNGWHGLVQTNLALDSSGRFLAVRQTHGPWFSVYYGYAAILLLSATYALIWGFPKSLRLHRPQVALLVAVFAPWTASLLHIAHIDPVHRFDLTPAAFSLSTAALVLCLRRAGLFDLLPVARDLAIREIGQGMLFVSREPAILDVNPAAVRLPGADRRALVGSLRTEALPALRDAAGFFDGSDATLHVEGATHSNGEVVSAEIARATRRDDPLAFVTIDIDDFRQVNGRLGHQAGDRVLQDIGRVLLANVRSYDLVVRYGGRFPARCSGIVGVRGERRLPSPPAVVSRGLE
jgi:hypothetical protein